MSMDRIRPVPLVLALLAIAALVAPAALAEEPSSGSESADVAAAPPVYQLPAVGKSTGRVGGGRRGTPSGLPDLYTLVPDHVGYTTSAHPVLYWYLSDQAKGDVRFELTVIDEKSVDPLVDKRFTAPASPGLQRIDLAEQGIALEPGQEYQWSISLVPDPADRSKDLVSSGWIERIPVPEGLPEKLESAGPGGAASVYGEAGLWYDLLAVTAGEVDANPEDAASRARLAALLEQVGLPDAAARQ